MKTIFTLAAIGGAAASAISYAVLPVFAPGAMLISANLGLLSGAFMGLAAKSLGSDNDALSVFGTVGFGILSLGVGGGAIYQSANSFDLPLEGALEKAIVQTYGADMEGLKAGHRIMLGVDLLGEESLPMIATAKGERNVSLLSDSDGGKVYLKFCTDFELAHRGQNTPGETVEACTWRYLKPQEIQRVLVPE